MRTTAASLLLLAISACGAPARSPDAEAAAHPPEAPESEASADASPSPAAGAAGDAKAASEAPAGGADSEAGGLARELMKTGGRRIGWSASKKSFVFPSRRRTGESASLDIVFTDESGHPKDVIRVCQADECDEHMAEKTAETLPKLTARLGEGAFVAVRAIGWPSGKNDLDVSRLGMKLRNTGGRLEGLKEGKTAVKLGAVKPPVIIAIYVTDDKKLGVFSAASDDAGETDQTFSVVNLP